MRIFKTLAIRLLLTGVVVCLTFSTPEALESNATPLQTLYMVKQLVPGVKKVGLMWNSAGENQPGMMDQIKRGAAAIGAEVVVEEAESMPDVAGRFRDLTDNYHVQAIWVIQNTDVLANSISKSYLIKNSAVSGVPLFAPSSDWVSEGACAAVVNEGGTTKLVVNQKTLNALGLKVPEKYASVTQFLATN